MSAIDDWNASISSVPFTISTPSAIKAVIRASTPKTIVIMNSILVITAETLNLFIFFLHFHFLSSK